MPSSGEEMFSLHCRALGLIPESEFKFCEDRRWRFDFCFPEEMVGVEIEGAVWTSGRHTRGSGYVKDMEKYNTAALLGYRVLRFSTEMVNSGIAIDFVEKILKGRKQ